MSQVLIKLAGSPQFSENVNELLLNLKSFNKCHLTAIQP